MCNPRGNFCPSLVKRGRYPQTVDVVGFCNPTEPSDFIFAAAFHDIQDEMASVYNYSFQAINQCMSARKIRQNEIE